MNQDKKDLFYLNDLSDYKVAEDYNDVRGWDVRDVEGRVVGKVDEFLVSKRAKRVVYLDVYVDASIIEKDHDVYEKSSQGIRGFLNKNGENHLIIPIGMVTIRRETKDVIASEINYETFAKTKRFEKGFLVNLQYEVAAYNSYRSQPDGTLVVYDENFYKRKEFGRL